jgi:hypothetical protein
MLVQHSNFRKWEDEQWRLTHFDLRMFIAGDDIC